MSPQNKPTTPIIKQRKFNFWFHLNKSAQYIEEKESSKLELCQLHATWKCFDGRIDTKWGFQTNKKQKIDSHISFFQQNIIFQLNNNLACCGLVEFLLVNFEEIKQSIDSAIGNVTNKLIPVTIPEADVDCEKYLNIDWYFYNNSCIKISGKKKIGETVTLTPTKSTGSFSPPSSNSSLSEFKPGVSPLKSTDSETNMLIESTMKGFEELEVVVNDYETRNLFLAFLEEKNAKVNQHLGMLFSNLEKISFFYFKRICCPSGWKRRNLDWPNMKKV